MNELEVQHWPVGHDVSQRALPHGPPDGHAIVAAHWVARHRVAEHEPRLAAQRIAQRAALAARPERQP